MILLDYDEIDFATVNIYDIICRRHFPFKPMKVVFKDDSTIKLVEVGGNSGFVYTKNKSEFEESNYVRPKLN